MRITSRVFFIEENGDLRGSEWSRYEKLYFADPSVRFAEYSGRAVKGVHVVVELDEGVPVSLVQTNFFVTYFSEDGGDRPGEKAGSPATARENEEC